MNLDVWLFHAINDLAGASAPLDWVVRLAVNDYTMPTLAALILGALWFSGPDEVEREKNQRAILYAGLGLVLTNVIVKIGWDLYFRPRPFAAEEGVKLLFYRPAVSSFPSEPVATLTALATGVWLFNRRVGGWMGAVALVFAFSRVMAGVHYPSDIVAGALLAIICTYLPYRYVPFFDKAIGRVIGVAKNLNLA